MDEHSIGMRFVSEKETERGNPDLYLALEQAENFGATAVYFRFYNDNKPPRPQVYIYDRTELKHYAESDADIHHKLWNAGIVPFCFIFRASKILVYNCGKKPKYDDDSGEFVTSHHELINLLSDTQQEFDLYNARKFDSGLFWESGPGKKFNYNEGAYQQLLDQLKNVKSIIISRIGNEHASLVKRLLMMLILVKYLEERKGEDGNGALIPHDFYRAFNPDEPTLEGVLKNTDTFMAVLKELSKKELFNGQIFRLNEAEQSALKENINLELLRHFVRGDMEFFPGKNRSVGQVNLWRLYAFNYLPIELISHIYEDFLADEDGQKKKGVVYTPPYLVQFLIDQAMPLSAPKENFKVLDPACGSGIFLVGAYKRMIQWWRQKNDWKKPGKEHIEELKQLLKDAVYGCDIEEEAVTLTYFSLCLALLDSLSPKEIWGNVHFDDLIGVNLVQGDFFKTLHEGRLKKEFQLVIGNPPFESKFTDWAEKIDLEERENHTDRPNVPDNQVALLFLEQSLKLLAKGGRCCLILPSGPALYNVTSLQFRSYLMRRYYFEGIFDFTPLRTKLFVSSSSSAKPAVAAITAINSEPRGRSCYHYIFRRTKVSGEKIDFEIDHYDIHEVTHGAALDNERVWQSNFMGGGRLHYLLDKISRLRTLHEYLEEKCEQGWKIGEGWKTSNEEDIIRVNQLSLKKQRNTEEEAEFNSLEEKYKADWITGHNHVITSKFTEKGIEKIETCDTKYFSYPRMKNKEIFQPPHLLIKEQAGVAAIPIEYREDYLTFKDAVIGVHAPEKDKHRLKRMEERFKNKSSYTALLWLLSGKIITYREGVVLKHDLLSLPYPEEEVDFDPIEKILLSDISIYYSEFRKTGEKSVVLTRPTKKDLEDFGQLFCRILNSVYENFKPLPPAVGNDFIAYPFVLGDKPEVDIPTNIEGIEEKLSTLMDSRLEFNLWVKRIVKVYHKNVIFLYKPNQKRYWLRSIAIRDADDTFLELYKQGK